MLQPLPDLPAGVIGFEVDGELHADDYKQTLLPAVDEAAAGDGVRLVLVFTKFEGLSAGAFAQDFKLGARHLSAWKRTALVTDIEWMTHLVSIFGWMTPGEFRHFPLDERAAAIAWAAEK